MANALYDMTLLDESLQERLIKNYNIEANRAKIGHVSGECYWNRQVMAAIIREGLPMSKYVSSEMYDALYNLYLKLSVK